MKSFKIMLLAFALVFCFTLCAQAQAVSGKIAYADINRIFDEYAKTKEYDAALAAKNSAYEEERNKKFDKIREAQGKLAALKADEKKKLEDQLEQDKAGLLEFDRQKQTDLKKERDEKMRELLLEIEKVVSDYGQKENYTLILNSRVLIYGGKELDITDQVIKLLNEKYPAKK